MSGSMLTMRTISTSALLSYGLKKHAVVQGMHGTPFVTLLHDDPVPIAGSFRVMKELPTYACYRFDISLFCLATKHKGKTQGNDEFICWLHWLYDFT
jgi:hypothetical protein